MLNESIKNIFLSGRTLYIYQDFSCRDTPNNLRIKSVLCFKNLFIYLHRNCGKMKRLRKRAFFRISNRSVDYGV